MNTSSTQHLPCITIAYSSDFTPTATTAGLAGRDFKHITCQHPYTTEFWSFPDEMDEVFKPEQESNWSKVKITCVTYLDTIIYKIDSSSFNGNFNQALRSHPGTSTTFNYWGGKTEKITLKAGDAYKNLDLVVDKQIENPGYLKSICRIVYYKTTPLIRKINQVIRNIKRYFANLKSQ